MILAERVADRRNADIWLWSLDNLLGPIPHPMFNDNGCTASPDFMLVTNEAIWPACRIHDWHYSGMHGDLSLTRAEADSRFRKNIYRVLRHQGAFAPRAAYYALIYWRAVRRLGGGHYKSPRIPFPSVDVADIIRYFSQRDPGDEV